MIVVRRAPAYATVQDIGRRGFMSSGVPRAGAMDRPALETLNALLGNDSNAGAIEIALNGGDLEFLEETTFALGGAKADARLDTTPVEAYRAYRANQGDVLTIDSITAGRFLYLAIHPGVMTPLVMRSRSTYLPGAFGGHEGRRLKNGDTLPTEDSRHQRRRHHVSDPLPNDLRPALAADTIRYVPRDDVADFYQSPWVVSPASDRTGYRLAGRSIEGGASITSEPVCPGTIQLPPGGEPIILMADAPTVGGYRILGAVITVDTGILAQAEPGTSVTFNPVSVEAAQRALLSDNERIERIREWSLA
jgi:biotin-dependent carboxylase-like uncharacterized protein